MRQLDHDPALFDWLTREAAAAPEPWRPTAYWRGYCRRIERELAVAGLRDMRRNSGLLKGFAFGGIPRPAMPEHPLKRAVWDAVERLPVTRTVVAGYRRSLSASHAALTLERIRSARLALERIAEAVPHLRIPPGSDNGNAEDVFDFHGVAVSAALVPYIARAADIYARLEAPVTAILEVGPGLGLSSLAHLALNPSLRLIVNVDIVPVLYLSGQYLRSIETIEVVTADRVAESGPIAIDPGTDRPRLFALGPWQLSRVEGALDLFLNAYSMQEMEKPVCAAYAAEALRLTRRACVLHSRPGGHRPGAGGQTEPIGLDHLCGLFAARFPSREPLPGLWPTLYDGPVEDTALLRP